MLDAPFFPRTERGKDSDTGTEMVGVGLAGDVTDSYKNERLM